MIKQLINDEGMKIFYRDILKINPDDCVLIEDPLNKLEITLGSEKILLPDFLKNKIRLVTMDNFSTKEVNEQAIASSGLHGPSAEVAKRLYLEYFRHWGVIEHKDKKVGIADSVRLYNGFPGLFEPEEFVDSKDPSSFYKAVFEKASQDPSLFFRQPQIYSRIKVGFHKDFLNSHAIKNILGVEK